MQARKMLFAAISSICVLSQTLKNQIPKRVKIFFFFWNPPPCSYSIKGGSFP